MSGKHTPGPWMMIQKEEDRFDPAGGGHYTVLTEPEICSVVNGEWHEIAFLDSASAEAVANARLIAAAPELLAELKRTRNRFFRACTHAGNSVEVALAACESIDAAIAKAEGAP